MPKYTKKPVEVEAFIFAVDDTPEWFLEKTKNSYCEFHYDSNGVRCILPTSEGSVMIIRAGDFVIKGVEGEIYPCESSVFEKTYDRVDPLKKARKMAELSGMLTKCGFNFTTEIKDLPDVNPGPIESPEISPANSFEIEREAHKKLIKELIREVLSEEPVTVSVDGKEIAEACAKAFTKSMRRDMRSK